MNRDIKKKLIGSIIAVIAFVILIAGATYAYLVSNVDVTNGNYVTDTHCFQIDYNINNTDGTQNITGILFPSAVPTKGLNGRVGFKTTNNCELNGKGTLKLFINSNNNTTNLTSIASSYCRSRKTGEAVNLTESECTAAGHRWVSIPTSYCENNATLETMTNVSQSDCTSNGGTWVTGGSPLKYAVYDNNSGSGTPVKAGYITSSDIGDSNGKIIYDNFIVTDVQKYYYIYIWMDGYLTDNSYNDIPFTGHIEASAIQDNEASR